MDVYALIPLKKLENTKTRLSNISLEARMQLSKAMLTDVIKATLKAKNIIETFVITPDQETLKLAERLGAKTIPEKDQRGLNVAVSEGTQKLEKRGAEGVLVILGDVPLVTPHLLDFLIKKAIGLPWVVIAPSRDAGTNILLRTPPGVIPHVYYGQNSSKIHIRIARYYHISYSIFKSPKLMIDVDTFQDFALIRKYDFEKETHTFRVLKELTLL